MMQETVALVADDHELFREALAALLTARLGLTRAVTVGSLDEAVEQLGRLPSVALAVFDLHMPGVEDASSLGAVRECFPEVRVAIVSGSSRRRDILTALEAGVHGYVPKDLPTEAILSALKTVLEGGVYVPASLADTAGRETGAAPAAAAEKLRLTPRQRDVLALLVEGRSNKEIARALQLGEGTVKIHVAALLQNLGVPNRAAAAAIGAQWLDDRLTRAATG